MALLQNGAAVANNLGVIAPASFTVAPRSTGLTEGHVRLVFCLVALSLLLQSVVTYPQIYGDGRHYALMAQALFDHGTPDLRSVDVLRATTDQRPPILVFAQPYASFYPGSDHRLYCLHFFAYSALTLPAKLIYHLARGPELSAFAVTNTLVFLATLGLILSAAWASLARRLIFAGLACINPILWYLSWPQPEVVSWAGVTAALVMLQMRRYPAAALLAGIASLQNPPIVFLALALVLLSLRQRSAHTSVAALAGASVALWPYLFYRMTLGVWNPIVSHHDATLHAVSLAKTAAYFLDPNSGMIVYLPVTLILAAIRLFVAARERDVEAMTLLVALAAMVVASETNPNWNNGCAGLNRYACWTLPLLAWFATSRLGGTRAIWMPAAVAGVAVQVLLVSLQPHDLYSPYRFTPEAQFMLEHAPSLYSPMPEIFVERTLHQESDDLPAMLPVGYVDTRGRVVKLLASAATLERIPQRFRISPAHLADLHRLYDRRPGVFYVDRPERWVGALPNTGGFALSEGGVDRPDRVRSSL